MTSHTLVVIQNLRTTFNVIDKIQKRKVTWSTRGTVTRLSYRKWRVRARSLSTETAATDNKETPDVVQAVLPWSSLNQQYAVKFLSSSAILDATKSGWHMRPTRRSEAAKEPKRTKDGVWRSRVFFYRKKNWRVGHKCYDTEKYVEDAGWNVCYDKILRIIKTDTCKVEAGCFSFVHGLHDRKKLSCPPTRWSYHQKLIKCKVH